MIEESHHHFIIFVVDESGSMGTVQANLRNNIGLFANILTGTGQVDAQYGLVGYGNSSAVPRMLTDLTDVSGFSTAAQRLVTSGSAEPGRTATAFALSDALYNGVLSGNSAISSYSTLITDQGGTVFNLSLFNTTDQTVVEAFVADFAAVKLQETLDFCQLNPTHPACQPSASVPEPSTLALIGLGLAGVLSRSRKHSQVSAAV